MLGALNKEIPTPQISTDYGVIASALFYLDSKLCTYITANWRKI